MHRQSLDSAWTLRAVGDLSQVPAALRDRSFAARVPSCAHTVLLRHGAIDDPYLGEGEALTAWIGLTDWEYRLAFDADDRLFDHERIDLACDGLDTIATVCLNDAVIGRGENMHVGYRFDVRSALRRGNNVLSITLASPVRYARSHRDRLGPLPAAGMAAGPYNFIRKMACNFGWDWGPQLTTSGIWRPVALEGWSRVRIARVIPQVLSATAESASVRVRVETESTDPRGTRIVCSWVDAALGSDQSRPAAPTQSFDMVIHRPDLWWPVGHGRQPRYGIDIDVRDDGDRPLDGITRTIGLRTIELDTAPDDIGRRFVVKVNGKPIFCRGFNWIPDDCFLDRANDPARLRRRIRQAVDCGTNMLRVWGGGIYETDDFYDLCDEMGVLVWQDFLFACAAYPEEAPFKSLVEQEARDNVARLSHHPSLVLWNGNNENLWGYRDWGWQKNRLVDGRTWGPGYYFDLLPKLVQEIDASRPYWAGSPWSGDHDVDNGLHPNLETHGNKHVWEVWHGPGDYANYRRFTPRFCSEFGFQGPPTFATLSRVMPPDQRRRDSRQMEIRQKSPGGNERNDRIAAMYFDLPAGFDDYLYILQVMQARAVTCGVEWFRSRQPTCMGTLIWQLNDCWPVHSWAAIDGDGREKPLFFAARRFYADRLLTIQPAGAGHQLHAINDSDAPWTDVVTIAVRDFVTPGAISHRAPFTVEARGQAIIPLPSGLLRQVDPSRQCLAAHADGARPAFWFDAPDRLLHYPVPQFDADLSRIGEEWLLRLSAGTLLRDACIFVDRIDPDATVSDQMLTLLPGESAEIRIRSTRSLTVEQLLSPPVFNCVNRFGATRGAG